MTAQNPNDFLLCATPESWIEKALNNLPTLLIDHAHCEKKAASCALHLIHKYGQYDTLAMPLSKLAREELRHFELVLKLLKERNIKFIPLKSGSYAESLRQLVRHQNNNDYLVDILIINAIIEARSCERFAAIAPHLDEKLGKFYSKLYKSEERHFHLYLEFAKDIAKTNIQDRVTLFLSKEALLIETKDPLFRFHSGS